MTLDFTGTMAEVTRLTRKGQLTQAVALIQSRLSQTKPSTLPLDQPATPTASPRGLKAHLGQLFDLLGKPGAPACTPTVAEKPVSGRTIRVPDKARFEEHTFSNAAGQRTYKLFVPDIGNTKPLPLIVMLHGCTQNPDDFAIGTGMNEQGIRHRCLVAYPAQPASANPARCWNWFSTGDQARDRGEPSIIAGLTRQIMRDHAVDPARVYVAGLSAGGAAAAIMGQAYPDLYAAVGVHSGLACGAAKDLMSGMKAMRQGGAGTANGATRALPTIVFHGDRDGTVSPINGEQVISQATANGAFRVTQQTGRSSGGVDYTRAIHSDAAGRAVLEHWVLHGGGHAWSGGNAGGSFTDPRGPNASAEMVRFFLAHKR